VNKFLKQLLLFFLTISSLLNAQDTEAPVAPTLTGPVLTNNTTPTLTGTAEAGSMVKIYEGSTVINQAMNEPAYKTLADLVDNSLTTNGNGNYNVVSNYTLSEHLIIENNETLFINANVVFDINANVYVYNKGIVFLTGTTETQTTINNYGIFINENLINSSRNYEYFYNKSGASIYNLNPNQGEGPNELYNFSGQSGSIIFDVNSTLNFGYYNYNSGTYTGGYTGGVPEGAPNYFSIVTSALVEGSHLFFATATDAAGNESVASSTIMVVVDLTAPVITLNGDATVSHELGTTYVDMGATALDEIDGDITNSIIMSGVVDVNTLGSYALTYNASDAAGNAAIEVTRMVNVVIGLVLGELVDLEMDEDTDLLVELTATSNIDAPFMFDARVLVPFFDAMENDEPFFMAHVIHHDVNGTDSLHLEALNDWFGTAEVEVSVHNEAGFEDIDTVSVTVNPVDDEPIVDGEIQYIELIEDFSQMDEMAWEINLDDVFFDIDGELEYSVSFTDATVIGAQIDMNMLSLYSLEDGYGETHMIVTASNPMRAFVSDTVLVVVLPVNDAPMFLAPVDPIVLDEDTSYEMMSFQEMMDVGTLTDVDNLLDELDFDIHANGPNLHVEWDGDPSSNPVLVPDENYNGMGTLILCVNDGEYEVCAEKTVTITPLNDAPLFVSDLEAVVGLGLEFHVDLHVDDIDSDTLFVSLVDGPIWLSLTDGTLHGTATELGMFPVELSLTDGELTVIDTFDFHVENFTPQIIEIADVPNDQGGRVYLGFNGSFLDNGVETGQSYSVFRWDTYDGTEGWVGVQSLDAIGQPFYVYEVTTVMDSTVEGPGYTDFMVVASMNNGIFASLPMMGYSVDNIHPGVPAGVMATVAGNTVELLWEGSMDEDFQYYIVEKSSDAEFTVLESMETAEASYVDVNYVSSVANYYRVAAVDHSGNQSDYSDVVDVAVVAIDDQLTPDVFAIHQNYPNPFNPTTQIRYDLPEDALVSINIYDLMGRSIRSLVNTTQSAGYRSIQWDATNNLGEPVSAGMYIYMIQAGEFKQTKKMVLLK
jgi:hypothetical protein